MVGVTLHHPSALETSMYFKKCVPHIDKLTWSKLETGRLPSADEVKMLVQDVMGPRALFDIGQEEDETSFDS